MRNDNAIETICLEFIIYIVTLFLLKDASVITMHA